MGVDYSRETLLRLYNKIIPNNPARNLVFGSLLVATLIRDQHHTYSSFRDMSRATIRSFGEGVKSLSIGGQNFDVSAALPSDCLEFSNYYHSVRKKEEVTKHLAELIVHSPLIDLAKAGIAQGSELSDLFPKFGEIAAFNLRHLTNPGRPSEPSEYNAVLAATKLRAFRKS